MQIFDILGFLFTENGVFRDQPADFPGLSGTGRDAGTKITRDGTGSGTRAFAGTGQRDGTKNPPGRDGTQGLVPDFHR